MLMINTYFLLSFFLLMAGCGPEQKARPQADGTLSIPDFPVIENETLGLGSSLGSREKNYTGQLLIWNLNAEPDAVARVIEALEIGNNPYIAKYKFLKEEASPLIQEFMRIQNQRRELVRRTDPRLALVQQRRMIAEQWYEKKLDEAEWSSETSEEQKRTLIEQSRERFIQYCEAKIWQRVFLRPYVNVKYTQRPTPNAVCEPVYAQLSLIQPDQKLCSPDASGKDYTACLWYEGVLKSRVFKSWYGNDPELEKLFRDPDFFQQLSEIAKDSAEQDVGEALLNGTSLVDRQGKEVLSHLPIEEERFPDFTYKKCRRYRVGCVADISVSAARLKSIIDYIEINDQILLFSDAQRGSNHLGVLASLDMANDSVNESVYNDAFALNYHDDDDLASLDEMSQQIFDDFPISMIDESSREELDEVTAASEQILEKINEFSLLLERDRTLACEQKGNFYCPIQDATNNSLQLAVQPEVSSGVFRSVTLKASGLSAPLSDKKDAYLLEFGFSENKMHAICLAGDGHLALTGLKMCRDSIFDKVEYDPSSGVITLETQLTADKIKALGLIPHNDRPHQIDLFDHQSQITEIDFSDFTMEDLKDSYMSIEFIPYSVQGMFEKLAGTFKVTKEDGRIISLGNFSLQETEATHPLDVMWFEFKKQYLD